MITRQEYLNGSATHFQYYSQMVTQNVIALIKTYFDITYLMNAFRSGDTYFNTIPLKRWDFLATTYKAIFDFKGLDFYTLAGAVCILKQAAREICIAELEKQQ